MNLTGPTATAANLFSSSATRDADLGAEHVTRDGRKFRYCQAGLTALVAGNVIQAPAQITTHDQLTATAAAVGATRVTVTLDATNAVVANQYAGGWAVVDTTPGEGYAYPIKSHPAAEASAAVVLTLHADAPLQVAWTTATRVTLVPNPYKGVIQSPVTTLTGVVVGVAIYPIGISQYGWLQTHGPCGVLIAGTPGVGLAVVVPGTAAGAVVIDGAASATQVVGAMMVTGVDGKILPVFLNIN